MFNFKSAKIAVFMIACQVKMEDDQREENEILEENLLEKT